MIDTSRPVMVTGATGYVAGWIVKELLEAGCTVHAPVRDPNRADKVGHLHDVAKNAPGELRFFTADLLKEGSYDDAASDCGVVFHTASPFSMNVDDPQKALVDPALEGTHNVLNAATRAGSIERVVLTSSCVAIYGDNTDVAAAPGGRLTESVWNTSSSLTHGPYAYSKTLAEKAAWEMAEAQEQWKLVTINPSLVIGPALQKKPTSASFDIVRQMGDGTMQSGAPRLNMGVVDVRDLAKAHVEAGFRSKANGRHIVSGYETDLYAMSLLLREKYGSDYRLPKRAAPKWLLWLFGPLMDKSLTRKYISRNVNVPWRADNSKGKRELGIEYRPLQESMEEMFQQMIESGTFS